MHAGQWPCICCWEGPASHEGPMPTLGADLALSLLCEWSVVPSSAWLSCVFLVILIPRCSGQKCLNFCSWWHATGVTCLSLFEIVFCLETENWKALDYSISIAKLSLHFLVKPSNFFYASLTPESATIIVPSQWMMVAFFTYLSFTRLQNLAGQR